MGEPADERDGGFALFGFLVGLAAGGAVYAVAEVWIGEVGERPLPLSVLLAIAIFGAALLLLTEKGARIGAVVAAALIAGALALPTWHFLAESGVDTSGRDPDIALFPAIFWFLVGAPLSGFLFLTLAKASLLDRFPPPYSAIFFHGLTLPLIAAGAALFAGFALVLLFAWAALLRSLDVDFFHNLFQEPWFLLPFLGAVGGLSIAMIRGMQSVLGALRFLLLLFARIAMPITAVFSVTLIAVLATKGTAAIFAQWSPAAIMLGLSFAGMLIFNGVYQNGEGEPPPPWLRIASAVALLAFPIYAGFAAWAFSVRVDQYGLTPERIYGLAMTGLAALYSVVCLAGLLGELWGAKRWMPAVGPLNTLLAVVWAAALIALASPLVNPWELSAKNQELRLRSGRVDATEFDYGYLRFALGKYGDAALARLGALEDHPQAAEIAAGVARARAAPNRWYYDHSPATAAAGLPASPVSSDEAIAPSVPESGEGEAGGPGAPAPRADPPPDHSRL